MSVLKSFLQGFVETVSLTVYTVTENTDTTPTTLKEIEWEVEKAVEDRIVTERLGWADGEEKTVTYSARETGESEWEFGEVYLNREGELVFEVMEPPAYIEFVSMENVEEERTRTKTAWVTEVPPGAEPTGEEKVVYEDE